MTKIDEKIFDSCKWCNGSGNDGTGVCPDCECTGYVGGMYAVEVFDEFIEQKRLEYEANEAKQKGEPK